MKVINIKDFRKKKEETFISSEAEKRDRDLAERIRRFKHSMERIERLMAELSQTGGTTPNERL